MYRAARRTQLIDQVNEIANNSSCSDTRRAEIHDLKYVWNFNLIYPTDGNAVPNSIEITTVPIRRSYRFKESVIEIICCIPVLGIQNDFSHARECAWSFYNFIEHEQAEERGNVRDGSVHEPFGADVGA